MQNKVVEQVVSYIWDTAFRNKSGNDAVTAAAHQMAPIHIHTDTQ